MVEFLQVRYCGEMRAKLREEQDKNRPILNCGKQGLIFNTI